MAEFYFDNLAKNLPDCYKKDVDSNNYKILEIERLASADLRVALDGIASILNIDNATGAVLDMYGERFGQPRGKATDAQYITMIKSKIARSLSSGSYKDVIDAICYTFNCRIDEVSISETDTPMNVIFDKAPLDKIINAGFSAGQASEIIRKMLPVGTTAESILFEGTFEFSDIEDEYSETTGFSEKENGEFGGYLGWIGNTESEDKLPI